MGVSTYTHINMTMQLEQAVKLACGANSGCDLTETTGLNNGISELLHDMAAAA